MAGSSVRGNSRGATLHLSNPLSCAGHGIAAFENALGYRGRHVFPTVAGLHVGKPGWPPPSPASLFGPFDGCAHCKSPC